MKHLFITGYPNAGKSYLVNQLIHHLSVVYEGFLSKPFTDEQTQGYYLHSIRELEGNDPIIIRTSSSHKEIFPDVFDHFGLQILHSIKADLVVLDELGFIEEQSHQFQKALYSLLSQDKIIIAVLRKGDVPWLRALKADKEALHIDLDNVEFALAYEISMKWLKQALKNKGMDNE